MVCNGDSEVLRVDRITCRDLSGSSGARTWLEGPSWTGRPGVGSFGAKKKKKKKGQKGKRKKGKNITCLLLREGTNRKAERIMMIKRGKKI